MTKSNNIHPVFDRIINRETKQKFLKQKSKVLWFTGLSGSGKSTIAIGVEKMLFDKGFLTQIIDGDNVRTGINNNLGFSLDDRYENIRRVAEVSKLFLNCGIITLNSFVSPTIEIRNTAKNIIGKNDFIEIYVKASVEECERRDVKGLYKKARKGEIKDFTGIHQQFEEPDNPFLIVDTEKLSQQQAINLVYEKILPLIQNN